VRHLIIGVERSLLKDKEIKSLCESNAWFQKYGFEYSQFPTVSGIKRVLAKQ
jgi:hypothetical protein